MGYENTLRYVAQKHDISPHHIGEINQIVLKRYLLSQNFLLEHLQLNLFMGGYLRMLLYVIKAECTPQCVHNVMNKLRLLPT
jgi:hypothetical protein